MNKIVLHHYPVDKLPEDLRRHFSRGGSVTLEVVEERTDEPEQSVEELVRAMRARHAGRLRSQEDIVAEIRALRDEWDD
ncbi:hypothetical protein [Pelagibacterium lacus]|nr:hypothetical protein [Pelagibacterium lacus]